MLFFKLFGILVVLGASQAKNLFDTQVVTEFEVNFPFIVSIQKKYEDNQFYHWCSGVLINEKYVLTAASYRVEVGDIVKVDDKSSMLFNISQIFDHLLEISDPYLMHDTAILVLDTEEGLSITAPLINLLRSEKNMNRNEKFLLVDYFLQDFDATILEQLGQSAYISTQNISNVLKRIYKTTEIAVSKSHLCLEVNSPIPFLRGVILQNSKDNNWVLVGFTSRSFYEAVKYEAIYYIFTPISVDATWIDEQIKDHAEEKEE